ncbi:hypothetical protein C4577_02440 [Candidatus Parcubacteria bacterium]|nr:MAG: hypothetical protein C4577_02440 [Candidatus Parcubacteria bacterium]
MAGNSLLEFERSWSRRPDAFTQEFYTRLVSHARYRESFIYSLVCVVFDKGGIFVVKSQILEKKEMAHIKH